MRRTMLWCAAVCLLGFSPTALSGQRATGKITMKTRVDNLGILRVGIREDFTVSSAAVPTFQLTGQCDGTYAILNADGVPIRVEHTSFPGQMTFRADQVHPGLAFGIGKLKTVVPPVANSTETAHLIAAEYKNIQVEDLNTGARAAISSVTWTGK